MDTIGTKELPVQVDWTGHLPDNLVLTQVTVIPPRVKVTGGLRILDSLETLYTQKVPLNDIDGSGSLKVDLDLDPASLKLATGSEEEIELHYQTVKRTVPRKVSE